IGGAIGVAILGALLASGLAQFSQDPNALVNPEARAHLDPAELRQLQGALEGTLRNIFAASATAVALAFLGALALPGGKMTESHSERMVMAEMTTIDAENEPEG